MESSIPKGSSVPSPLAQTKAGENSSLSETQKTADTSEKESLKNKNYASIFKNVDNWEIESSQIATKDKFALYEWASEPTEQKAIKDRCVCITWIDECFLEKEKMISLSGYFSFSIPPVLHTITWLRKLSLRSCQLTTIPDEIFNLKKLRFFDLTNNKIQSLSDLVIGLTKATIYLDDNPIDEVWRDSIETTLTVLEEKPTLEFETDPLDLTDEDSWESEYEEEIDLPIERPNRSTQNPAKTITTQASEEQLELDIQALTGPRLYFPPQKLSPHTLSREVPSTSHAASCQAECEPLLAALLQGTGETLSPELKVCLKHMKSKDLLQVTNLCRLINEFLAGRESANILNFKMIIFEIIGRSLLTYKGFYHEYHSLSLEHKSPFEAIMAITRLSYSLEQRRILRSSHHHTVFIHRKLADKRLHVLEELSANLSKSKAKKTEKSKEEEHQRFLSIKKEIQEAFSFSSHISELLFSTYDTRGIDLNPIINELNETKLYSEDIFQLDEWKVIINSIPEVKLSGNPPFNENIYYELAENSIASYYSQLNQRDSSAPSTSTHQTISETVEEYGLQHTAPPPAKKSRWDVKSKTSP